jgi:hypothetical protein
MIAIQGLGFPQLAEELRELLRGAPPVKTERWQGVPVNTDTYELRNVVFEVDLHENEDVEHWARQIKPNLPWADTAFEERVCGMPLNPGEAWKDWPWAGSAKGFIKERFNHHYCERLWPMYARRTDDGKLPRRPSREVRYYPMKDTRPNVDPSGNWAGDLQSLVDLLAKEPHTRQAVIPLFWPSETGLGDGGRKMCSLLYQFLVRNNQLHLYYPLRSCDFTRHWADDCYMGVRLLLWVLEQCRFRNPGAWDYIKPGSFAMHCTSLHIFAKDKEKV